MQESSISISPWGVGLEYEAGQILDPINDAVERLSEACVHSMALLGAQRIVLGIINQYGIVPFYLTLISFMLLIFLGKGRRFARLFGRLALILLLVRLSTPVLCFLGSILNQQYFDPRIEQHTDELAKVQEVAWAEFEMDVPEVTKDSTIQTPELLGIPDFFRNIGQKVAWYSEWMKKRASALGDALRYLRENFTEIMEYDNSFRAGDRKNYPPCDSSTTWITLRLRKAYSLPEKTGPINHFLTMLQFKEDLNRS